MIDKLRSKREEKQDMLMMAASKIMEPKWSYRHECLKIEIALLDELIQELS